MVVNLVMRRFLLRILYWLLTGRVKVRVLKKSRIIIILVTTVPITTHKISHPRRHPGSENATNMKHNAFSIKDK